MVENHRLFTCACIGQACRKYTTIVGVIKQNDEVIGSGKYHKCEIRVLTQLIELPHTQPR